MYYSIRTLSLYVMLSITLSMSLKTTAQNNDPIILGYFPSWSENYTSTDQNSKLREIPTFVNYVFLSFAKPDLTYIKDSFDISDTGIQVPYDGCTLKESVAALSDKGVNVILSIGGETYWTSDTIYNNINYQHIKDFVDDMGFIGIDWDFEPNGSFANIGSPENIGHFIDFFNQSRALMPRSDGYILACAPAGVGALGGQVNDDATSPFAFANRNTLTGESDANLYNGTAVTNGINLFGFSATGHMIPVIQQVGDKIDLIAFQGYNTGGSANRSIMYDAYAYYAETYGFKIAAGTHYPDEPWGPYYEYTHQNVASLSNHIANHPDRINDGDGIMIWQLLLEGTSSSAYSYLNVASMVLNGSSEADAINNANNYTLNPYTGGSAGCGGGGNIYCGHAEYNATLSYPTAGTRVFHSDAIWENQWWANPGEEPGVNAVWNFIEDCVLSNPDDHVQQLFDYYYQDNQVIISLHDGFSSNSSVTLYDLSGKLVRHYTFEQNICAIDKTTLSNGIYIASVVIGNKKQYLKIVL